MLVICLGGSLDGEFVQMTMPLVKQHIVPCFMSSEVYSLTTFTSDSKSIQLYALEGMTTVEIISQLIDGYI